jgi:hypothetical protein
MFRSIRLLPVVLAVLAGFALPMRGEDHRCPQDMRWGGEKCEWANICKDNTPMRAGKCPGDDTVKVADITPAPEPMPTPVPAAQPKHPRISIAKRTTPEEHPPVPQTPIPSQRPIVCADGHSPVNGKCSPQIRSCERVTLFRPTRSTNRRVLLCGGDAAVLFDRYVGDARARALKVDFEALTAIVYDISGQQNSIRPKMSLGDLFSGMTYAQVFRKALKNVQGAPLDNPEAEAAADDADLVCGSQRK